MIEQDPRPPPDKSFHVDLSSLQTPQGVKTLIELIEHASLDSPSLRAIRDAAATQLTSSRNMAELSTIRVELAANQRAQWKREVFGNKAPSLQRFRQYLQSLTMRGSLTFDDRREIVSCINYWRKKLDVDFLFQGTRCVLGTTSPSRDRGGFQLRKTGTNASYVYARTAFPPLEIRRRT